MTDNTGILDPAQKPSGKFSVLQGEIHVDPVERRQGGAREAGEGEVQPASSAMDLLEDLGFALDLEECDISEEGAAADPESTDVLAAARRFQSGRSAAQQAYGDGKWRVGAGPMRLDWRCCVERMLSTTSLAEREECVRALGTLAQVALHGDAMREAGVVGGVTSLLSDAHEPVAIAAAEALRHLACANT